MSEQNEFDAGSNLELGDIVYLKVKVGNTIPYLNDKGKRLVQVTVFQPFAQDAQLIVREDAIVAAPPGTEINFSCD